LAQSNPAFLAGIVEQLAGALVTQARQGDAIAQQIRVSAADIAQKLFRTVALMGETRNIVNSGAVCHLVATEGGLDVRRFRGDERLGNIFELTGGTEDHACDSYSKVLQRSKNALNGATLPRSPW
jgi:hypothetical protein